MQHFAKFNNELTLFDKTGRIHRSHHPSKLKFVYKSDALIKSTLASLWIELIGIVRRKSHEGKQTH